MNQELIDLWAFQLVHNKGKEEAIKTVEFKIELQKLNINDFNSIVEIQKLEGLQQLLEKVKSFTNA